MPASAPKVFFVADNYNAEQWSADFCSEHASQNCATCGGRGVKHINADVCTCVLRTIVQRTVENLKLFRSLRHNCGTRTGFTRIEYDVDALRIAQNTLTPEQWRYFVAYALCDMEWHEAAEANTSRSSFFNEMGRINVILGRAFREASLFPANLYMFTKIGAEAIPVATKSFVPVVAPIKRSNVLQFPSERPATIKRRRTARVLVMPMIAEAA